MEKKLTIFCLLFLFAHLLFSNNYKMDFASSAGTMNINEMNYCFGDPAFPLHNGDENLDAGDLLKFVIHDNNGTSLGNMFGGQGNVNTAYGVFPGMDYGITYYISAIAGMDDGTGKVDLTDPELSVSQGTPVIFLEELIADPGIGGVISCTSSQVTLGGGGSSIGGNYSYSWTGPNGFSSSVQFPVITEAGTYCFLLIDIDNSCVSSTECVTVTGNIDPPTANANVSNILTCVNPFVILSAAGSSTGPNIIYSWTFFNTQIGTGTVLTVLNPGVYTLTVTDTDNGCSSSILIDVSEDSDAPIAEIQLGGTIDCNNTEVFLDGSASSGGNLIYQWSTGNSAPTIFVTAPGTYTLTVTDGNNGCTDETSIIVSSNSSIPIADAGPDMVLDCMNQTAILNGSGSSTGGNFFYEWITNNGNILTGETTLNPVVDSEGFYFLIVTDLDNGCTATDEVSVSGTGGLAVDLGVDTFFPCNTSEMVIVGNVIPTGTGFTYLWTTTDGTINSGGTTVSPTIGSVGTYALEINDPVNGCVGYDEIVIYDFNDILTVNENMNLSCNSPTSNELDASILLSNLDLSYSWTTTNGNFTSATDILNPTVDMEGVYDLLVTDNLTGCTTTASITMGSAIFPEAIIDTNGNFVLDCIFSAVVLNGSNSIVNQPATYVWSFNGNAISTASVFTVINSGVYELIVTDLNNGCTDSESIIISENQNPPDFTLPSVVELNCNNNFQEEVEPIFNSPGGNYSYNWMDQNGVSFSQDPSFIFTENNLGFYLLEVTDQGNGCSALWEGEIVLGGFDFDVATTEAGCDLQDGTATVTSALQNSLVEWSTGQQGNTLTGLASGWYSVTVTDTDNNCSRHKNFLVDEDISCKVVISGYVVVDPNNTCTYDASMQGVENVMVKLNLPGVFTLTDSTGYYEFVVDDGTYQVEYVGSAAVDLQCPMPGTYDMTLNMDGMVSSDNHFFVSYPPFDLCIYKSVGNARPGLNQFNCVQVCNNSFESQDAIVTFEHDSIFSNQSPWPNISPAYGNTISPNYTYDDVNNTFTWMLDDLNPGECRKIMWWMPVPVTTPFGYVLHSEAKVNPIAGDSNPANNCLSWTRVVTASYDPNIKENFVGETTTGGAIYEDDTTMDYLIHFQNVGNDTAFTVVVRDTLDDAHLDVTTIRGFSSSHDMQVDFEGTNVLVFTFENIYLVDSMTNEEASQGWLGFNIDLLPGQMLGTEITNEAAIYFDYNAPIITNEIVNTIESHFYKIEGVVKTENGEGVKDVNVLLSNDLTATTLSDASGTFSFEDLEPDWNLELNFEKNTNPWNGVTTQDIVAIRKHILGLEFLDSPYKLLAADVNNSGSITGLDMALIRSLILLNIMEFPNNDSWKIVDGDYVFINPTQPWNDPIPTTYTINNIDADRAYNMIGIKIGDVNDSAQPWNLLNSETREKNGNILLSVDNEEVSVGKEYLVALRTKDFNEMVAYQFTLDFDKEKLNFTGFEKGIVGNMSEQNIGTRFLENGKLTVAWTTSEGKNINDGEPLFFLKFKAKQEGNLSEMLEINSSKTEAIAYDEENNVFDVNLIFEGENEMSILQVFPNPTDDNIFVNINLEKSISIQLDIFNAFGQLEKMVLPTTIQPKGFFQQKINVQDFSTGTYFIKMKIGEEIIVRKFIVI
ncbi:MAG: T9SS type A sorting domain-containing protein [Saprospiraceae bacterium]